jgi:hypothetical protein
MRRARTVPSSGARNSSSSLGTAHPRSKKGKSNYRESVLFTGPVDSTGSKVVFTLPNTAPNAVADNAADDTMKHSAPPFPPNPTPAREALARSAPGAGESPSTTDRAVH